MSVFQIRQSGTGAILWTGAAANEIQAMDAMAHEAGYYDHSDLPESVRGRGLRVEALSFGAAPTQANAGRVQGGRTGQFAQHSGSGSQGADRATG
ncbi:hypothetical protein MPAR168_07955 [Methylorubrum populi]|uniref:Uncharacterized protein n=1 Tax=Methylobacterium radiotolerans TaxID=31998 RepID=A0ABU7TEU2_9HYPH|nr:hypothetical protein [Methylobacterium sp. B4]PXW66649.1 hypothetical protein BY998_101208 [Methylobacterium sp. B4]